MAMPLQHQIDLALLEGRFPSRFQRRHVVQPCAGKDRLVEKHDIPVGFARRQGSGRIYGMEAAAQLQLEPWTESLGLPSFMGGKLPYAKLNDCSVHRSLLVITTPTQRGR